MLRRMVASASTQRNLVLLMLLSAAAACWAWLLVQGRSEGPGMSGSMAMASPTMGLPAAAFLTIWAIMMIAMMFPAAAPMILAFHHIQSGRRARGEAFVSTWLFVAGYVAVWAGAGIAAYLGAIAAETIGARAGLSAASAARIGGGLLIAAGLYQLTPAKHACLSKCRSPIGFIMTAWRDGGWGALRMGMLHGALCFGCCWLLMVILFPLGIMNLAAMALVTAMIFAEKSLPWERSAVYGTAAVLIVYGGVVVAAPQALPIFTAPGPASGMPAMTTPARPPGTPMTMPGAAAPSARE
jgi:predicted metal-binding membrane protein